MNTIGRVGLMLGVLGASAVWALSASVDPAPSGPRSTEPAPGAPALAAWFAHAELGVAGSTARLDVWAEPGGALQFCLGSPLDRAGGWDSQGPWMRSAGGARRALVGPERALCSVLLDDLFGERWSPPASPIEARAVSFESTRTHDGQGRLATSRHAWRSLVATLEVRAWETASASEGVAPLPARVQLGGMGPTLEARLVASGFTTAGPPACTPGESAVRRVPGAEAAFRCQRVGAGSLLVEAQLDDQPPGWFLFDTGVRGTLLDTRFAEAAGLPLGESGRLEDVGGALSARWTRGTQLRAGPLVILEPELRVLDLSALSNALGSPLLGVLGSELISQQRVLLDLAAGSLRVLEAGAALPSLGKATALSVSEERGDLVVTAQANGVALRLIVDTGSEPGLVLNAPAHARLGLTPTPGAGRVRMGGVSGALLAHPSRVATLELSEWKLADVPVLLADPGSSLRDDTEHDGVLGVELLEQRLLLFDLARGELLLIPREPLQDEAR